MYGFGSRIPECHADEVFAIDGHSTTGVDGDNTVDPHSISIKPRGFETQFPNMPDPRDLIEQRVVHAFKGLDEADKMLLEHICSKVAQNAGVLNLKGFDLGKILEILSEKE